MRTSQIRNSVIQVLLATAFSFSASAGSVEQLSWLSGCWRSESNDRQMTEQWMKPAGNQMLGVSHTVAGGKTREFEFMRIVQEENGEIFFVAQPSG